MRMHKLTTVLAGALMSAATSTGMIVFFASSPHAQTQSPASPPPATSPVPAASLPAIASSGPASIPVAEVPFYAEWASSPHALRSAEPFTHWNKEGAIPAACAKCHSTPGFRDFVGADGTQAGIVNHPAIVGTVISCKACHNARTMMLTSVTFPSGLKVENLGANARCMTCHQGRESTASVNKAVGKTGDDQVMPKLVFINVHYTAAGATLMGTKARVGYEYSGKTYAGRFPHRAPYTGCINCHELHALKVKVADCSACHKEVTGKASLHKIRVSKVDYDGNQNINEGIAEEIEHMRTRLLAAIQKYAKTVAQKPIAYDPHTFPYFFVDNNGNGKADKDEAKFPNKYNAWTPRLLKAAYNYQFVTKDPGAFAHNPIYTLQLLYDSLSDLGNKVDLNLAEVKRPS